MSQVAVITGASAGIGLATAEEFARQGFSLALIARRKNLLDEAVRRLAQEYPRAHFMACGGDISSWEGVEQMSKLIASRFPAVNILVNNAGAYDYGFLEEADRTKLESVIDVNVKGTIFVTRHFLFLLRESVKQNRKAKVVNVSSVAGLWGIPGMACYSASKFAVAGFSDALRRELAGTGIEVGIIYPGPVRNFLKPGETDSSPRRFTMHPDTIAKKIYDLAASTRTRSIAHKAYYIVEALQAISPKMADAIQKRMT